MRWMAFSAFTPLMEVGPTNNVAPWSRVPEGVDAEVGAGGYGYAPEYDESLIAAWILYANLHDDLRAYSHAQAVKAHETGTPIVRPMIFMHPDQAGYKDLWTQYYYGPDLVVAPPWQTGQTRADVHVPPTGAWLDAWTRMPVTAGTVVSMEAPEHRIPILVRQGSGIDLGDLPARWDAALARARVRPDLTALAATVGPAAGR
jgi:alpha-glucosidase (family GH31 glycosyl hydrolase)